MNKEIKVGNTSFNAEVLQELTLTQAYERFSYLRRDVVKSAHSKAKLSKKGSKKRSKK